MSHDSAATTDTTPLDDARLPETRPARSPWGRRIAILVGVLVALLAVAAVIAELVLRQVVPGTVETAVRTQLGLSADHDVAATVGGGSVLWQTLTGSYRDVTLRVADAPLGELRGTLNARVAGMPINPTSGPLEGAVIAVTLTPEQLQPLLSSATVGLAGEVGLEGGQLQLKRGFPVFGVEVPLELSVALGARDGDLLVTPTRVAAAGLELTEDTVASGPAQLLAPLMETRTVCLADRYPAGLTLTDVEISSAGHATATLAADPRIALDPELTAFGSCGG